MIEIVLDENAENVFLNELRPVYEIEGAAEKSWPEYRALARDVMTQYGNEKAVIIHNNNSLFSINWFAVALFAESCLQEECALECIVFKVENRQAAMAAYRPFVGLTIGIKYIIRLYQEELSDMYREMGTLSYLGLNIKESYTENKLYMELPGEGEAQKIHTETTEEALVVIGILKSLALAEIPVHIQAEIVKAEKSPLPDINRAVDKVVAFVRGLFD